MIRCEIGIAGAETLKAKLNRMCLAVPRALQRVTPEAAAKVQAAAKSRAPVGQGDLQGSITYTVKKHLSGAYAEIGTDLWYAGYPEKGTGAKGKSVKQHGSYLKRTKYNEAIGGQKAIGYLYNGLKSEKKEVAELYAEAVNAVIRKETGT